MSDSDIMSPEKPDVLKLPEPTPHPDSLQMVNDSLSHANTFFMGTPNMLSNEDTFQ